MKLINSNNFIENFRKRLNTITENILAQKDIIKLISDCFLKKFKQFENKINENKDKLNSIFNKNIDNITNNTKDYDNLPPADNLLEYPDKSELQIEKDDNYNEINAITNSFSKY